MNQESNVMIRSVMRSSLRLGVLVLIIVAQLIGVDGKAADSSSGDWPQWLGPRRDGIWRETGILDRFPAAGPAVRWRVPVGGGYSSPSVAGSRVVVTDRQQATKASGPRDPFARGAIPGTERVLCLNADDGKVVWQFEYDCSYQVSYPAGPRAAPVIEGDRVFTLGTEGHLFCLSMADGKVIWSREFKKDFGLETPVWGFSAHPLLDGGKLICLVGGPGSLVVAFDKDNGKEIWRALSASEPGYCPPMIYDFGGRRELIIWDPEKVSGLDPGTGKLYWSQPFKIKSGLSIPTPRQSGENLFLTSFYNGSMYLRPVRDRAEPIVLWQGKSNSERKTDGLHAIMCTPVVDAGYVYGVCSYGQLRCLKLETGERVWEILAATTGGDEVRWANAFLVKNEGRYFLFNEKGDLIICRLSPQGYEEIDRAHLIEPVNTMPGRAVVWSHPAFAHRSIYVRSDIELVRASLARE